MEIVILIIWILCGIAAAAIASNRGANGWLWFALGVLFGPFGVAFSLAAGSGWECPYCRKNIHEKATKCPHCQADLAPKSPPPTPIREPTKRCPFCGETILAAAIKCRYCGETLSNGEQSPPSTPESEDKAAAKLAIVSYEKELHELRARLEAAEKSDNYGGCATMGIGAIVLVGGLLACIDGATSNNVAVWIAGIPICGVGATLLFIGTKTSTGKSKATPIREQIKSVKKQIAERKRLLDG